MDVNLAEIDMNNLIS